MFSTKSSTTSSIYCRHCGYDLRMLPGQVCPECGKAFDPADPRSFRRRPRRDWTRWVRRGVIFLLVLVVAFGGAWGWMYLGWRSEQSALAKLPGFRVIKSEPAGPVWVSRYLGPAAFALVRVRELNGSHSVVTDLSPLSNMTELRMLNIGGTPVTDLSPLAKMTGLRRLWLHSTPVTDLSALAGMTELQVLRLEDTHVTDFSPLAKMTGLRVLSLDRMPVTDLSPLANITGIQELWLHSTPVTDLSPLAGLTGMQELYLTGTRVTDLSPLAGMTRLRGLFLPKETISEAQAAELQKKLPGCHIERR